MTVVAWFNRVFAKRVLLKALEVVAALVGFAVCSSAYAEPPKLTGVGFSCLHNTSHIFDGRETPPPRRGLATPASSNRQIRDNPCNVFSPQDEAAQQRGEKGFWFVGVDRQTRLFEDGSGRRRIGEILIDAVSGPYAITVKFVPKPSESPSELAFDLLAPIDLVIEVCKGNECTSSPAVMQAVIGQVF